MPGRADITFEAMLRHAAMQRFLAVRKAISLWRPLCLCRFAVFLLAER
jgi:hypothetical protein